MIDVFNLAPHAFNALLLLIIGFMIKHALRNIEYRITRIENTFFVTREKKI